MRVLSSNWSFRVTHGRELTPMVVMLALTLFFAPPATSQWTQLGQAGGNYLSFGQAMSFRDGNLWFGRDKLYLSTDTGKSWNVQLAFPSADIINDIDFSDRDHGIVSAWDGVFLTSDGGQHWITIPGAGASLSAVLLDSENAAMIASYSGYAARATANAVWQSSAKNGEFFCVRTNHDRNICYYLAYDKSAMPISKEVWHTTDRGQTWQNPGGKFEIDSYTMAVDSCDDNLLYVLHENYYTRNGPNCHVIASPDMGTSWIYILTQPLPLLCGSIVTSTQGIYCQTVSLGLLRSTNKGASWKFVGGPSGIGDSRLMTVVNDTTIIAADSLGNVWKFSDPAAIANVRIPSPVVSPDTIQLSICDSSNLAFAVNVVPAPCHAYVLDTVFFTSADSTNRLTSFSHFTTDDSGFALQGSVLPLHTGTFKGLVHTRQRFGGLDYDRSAPVVFVVSPGLRKHTVAPLSLTLGPVSLCPGAFIEDTVTLRNEGCEGLELNGAVILTDTARFRVSSPPTRLARGDSARIVVRYQPTAPGADSTILVVRTNNGNDTIPIQGSAMQTRAGLRLANDTLFATACDTAAGLLGIVNPGCNQMVIDSAEIDSGYAFSFSGSKLFPVILGESQSKDVGLRLAGHGPGITSGILHFHYRVFEISDTVAHDTSFALTGIILPGPAHYVLSDSELSFGTVALCQSRVATLTLLNDGCDTLRLLKYTPNGDAKAFGLDTVVPGNLPPGDSEVLRFTCSPDSLRNYLASLEITTNGGSSRIALAATGIPDPPRVALAPTAIAFPNAVANCGRDTASVTFSNSSCSPIRVDSVTAQPSGIFSPIATAAPGTLAKDSSVILSFSFSPVASGVAGGSATIYYSDANGREHDTTIRLSGMGLPHAAWSANIAPPRPLSASVFDTVVIPIELTISHKSDAPTSGILPLEFKIICNTDVLSPFDVKGVNPAVSIQKWNTSGDTTTVDISIDLAKYLPASQDDSILDVLQVLATPFVSDSLATDITLASVSSAAFVPDCFDYSLASRESRFSLALGCGDPMLSRFIATQSLRITDLSPNPATRTIQVGYAIVDDRSSIDSGLLDRTVKWYIFDVNGMLTREGVALESPIVLSVRALSSGEYFLYLNRGTRLSREEVSRAFVIQR